MECIICKKTVQDGDKSVIQRPRIQGLLSLISSAEKRSEGKRHQDNLAKEILSKKNGILNGEIKIKYHIDCRKSYTSSNNIDRYLQSDIATAGPSNYSSTRLKRDCFDIRKMCLICNKSGTKKKKRLISVQTGNLNFIYFLLPLLHSTKSF